MFSAQNRQTDAQVVILDPKWRAKLDELRQLCAANDLTCAVCKQPVWARAGVKNRWHFAHKHLSDCPSSKESPELLQARAMLYEWLVARFGAELVSIEKNLAAGDMRVPRHFDCTAESSKGSRLAYWIFDRQAKPSDREAIATAATAAGHAFVPVFTATVMRRNQSPKGVLNLSTTERAFLARTEYDALYPSEFSMRGSLHYLDPDNENLTTLRAMSCTEWPQQFTGTEVTAAMTEVTIHGPTGQLVHPGEWNQLKAHRQQVAIAQQQATERYAREAQRQQELQARHLQALAERQKRREANRVDMRAASSHTLPGMPLQRPNAEASPPLRSIYDGRNAPCELCGRITPEKDWIVFTGTTGQCKCRRCMTGAT